MLFLIYKIISDKGLINFTTISYFGINTRRPLPLHDWPLDMNETPKMINAHL